MKQEINSRIMRDINSQIVDSYSKDKKQVMLNIDPQMFNQIASELDN